MNPNARHVIERKPRSKLQAFAEECPEVLAVLKETAMGTDYLRHFIIDGRIRCDTAFKERWDKASDRALEVLRRMAGEEPPR